MRFLIDECQHESLVGVAHTAGYDAVHVNHLGLTGQPDWVLAERARKDDFTLVTNNRMVFLRLYGKMDLHPGLIVVVPNVAAAMQRALFLAALQYLSKKELVNAVLEVSPDGNSIECVEYDWPAWHHTLDPLPYPTTPYPTIGDFDQHDVIVSLHRSV